MLRLATIDPSVLLASLFSVCLFVGHLALVSPSVRSFLFALSLHSVVFSIVLGSGHFINSFFVLFIANEFPLGLQPDSATIFLYPAASLPPNPQSHSQTDGISSHLSQLHVYRLALFDF